MRVLLQSGTAAMGAGCAAQSVLVLRPFMVCTASGNINGGLTSAAMRRAERRAQQHRALQWAMQGRQQLIT